VGGTGVFDGVGVLLGIGVLLGTGVFVGTWNEPFWMFTGIDVASGLLKTYALKVRPV
jgi:hypothetical protein